MPTEPDSTQDDGAHRVDRPGIEECTLNVLKMIGEDSARQGLLDTPKRVARSWEELTQGYSQNLEEIVNGAIFDEAANEVVLVKDIELYSLCEHHLLPFFGKCHVAYIPRGRVIGLSKLPRVVDMYARRLQVQERLTTQIADAVQSILDPFGVAVIIEAQHLCMMMRGVAKQNSVTKTSAMLGSFRSDPKTRAELIGILNS